MENIKSLNWKKIGWRTLQGFILFLLNSATWVWMITNFVGEINISYFSKTVEVSYFDTLDFKFKALIYLFMLIGILLSYCFVKLLYRNHKEVKRQEKAEQLENKKQENQDKKFEKLIDKIANGSK